MPEQQPMVLEFAAGLGRPRGEPGKEFVERTNDIRIDLEDLLLMAQAIEQECERS